jgi:hypothetical protein
MRPALQGVVVSARAIDLEIHEHFVSVVIPNVGKDGHIASAHDAQAQSVEAVLWLVSDQITCFRHCSLTQVDLDVPVEVLLMLVIVPIYEEMFSQHIQAVQVVRYDDTDVHSSA